VVAAKQPKQVSDEPASEVEKKQKNSQSLPIIADFRTFSTMFINSNFMVNGLILSLFVLGSAATLDTLPFLRQQRSLQEDDVTDQMKGSKPVDLKKYPWYVHMQ